MYTLLYQESPEIGLIATTLPVISYAVDYPRLAALLLIVLIALLYFYRYDEITKRYLDNCIISPAEGTITDITQDTDYITYSIFLSPINRHTQCYPINGRVIKRVYDQTGKFALAVYRDKSRDNEKKIHSIQTKYGIITVTQIAGFLPRRISSDDRINCSVAAGEYLGIIKFGSRVDITLPKRNLHMRTINGKVGLGQYLGYYCDAE